MDSSRSPPVRQASIASAVNDFDMSNFDPLAIEVWGRKCDAASVKEVVAAGGDVTAVTAFGESAVWLATDPKNYSRDGSGGDGNKELGRRMADTLELLVSVRSKSACIGVVARLSTVLRLRLKLPDLNNSIVLVTGGC